MNRFDPLWKRLVVLAAAVSLLGACEELDLQNEDNDYIKSDELATGDATALVLTADQEAGSFSLVTYPDRDVIKDIQRIHQDAVCRFDPITGLPFIIARLGSDAIDILDSEDGWKVGSEYSVEAGTNAQDIAVVSLERAYIARLGASDLLVVHPSLGTEIGRVDLSVYADGDGLPEAAWIYHVDGEVFVLLQQLENLAPTDYSTLVVIDGATGSIKSDIELSAANPTGKLRYSESVKQLVLIESGIFGVLEGGIEYFNPSSHQLSGLVITEEELGGDMVDAVIVSETKGYAVIGILDGDAASTSIVSFDPSTGKKLGDILVSDSWNYSFVELTPDGTELWVTDMSMTAPGIRIFDVTDDHELTEAPISVGLPPSMVCFVE